MTISNQPYRPPHPKYKIGVVRKWWGRTIHSMDGVFTIVDRRYTGANWEYDIVYWSPVRMTFNIPTEVSVITIDQRFMQVNSERMYKREAEMYRNMV